MAQPQMVLLGAWGFNGDPLQQWGSLMEAMLKGTAPSVPGPMGIGRIQCRMLGLSCALGVATMMWYGRCLQSLEPVW